MEIKRTVLVLHPAQDMYQLVSDVAAYPKFLSWCVGSEVLEQTHELQIARLDVSIAGIRQSLTTKNRLVAGELLTMGLVDGPFQRLAGEWKFTGLGAMGSKVALSLTFDFSHSVLSSAFRRGFAKVADKLVYDFSRRADEIFSGKKA